MTNLNRRQFLDRTKTTGLGMAAGLTILANAASVRGTPANDKITLGLIGAGGRGPNLAQGFLDRGDCQFARIADPNTTVARGLREGNRRAPGRQGPPVLPTTSASSTTTSRSTPW